MSNNGSMEQLEIPVMRSVARVALLLIAVLLVGSVAYYRQRMLFADSPHILFRVINDGWFHIEEYRIGSFITQLFPLVGAKLHLPFTLLVVLYSASFYLFYFAVAMIAYRCRAYGMVVLFALYLTVFVSDTYYWPNNEVHQGMAWLVLAFAVIFRTAGRMPLWLSLPLFAILFGLAVWTHPLVMFAAVFLWLFSWLEGSNWPFNRLLSFLYTGVLLLVAYLKFSYGKLHGYDSAMIEKITLQFQQRFAGVTSSPHFRYFLDSCITDYWLFVLFFVAGLVALVRKKKYLLLLLTFFSTVGYLLLVVMAYAELNSRRFYIESEYMPATIMACAPVVYYILPRLRVNAAIALISVIFLVRLGYIYNGSKLFERRIAFIEQVNQKMAGKGLTKGALPEGDGVPDNVLMLHWGIPVESMIYSKLKGDVPQRTFAYLNPDLIKRSATAGNDTLFGCYELRGVRKINKYYFQFDTTVPYKVMDYSSLIQ